MPVDATEDFLHRLSELEHILSKDSYKSASAKDVLLQLALDPQMNLSSKNNSLYSIFQQKLKDKTLRYVTICAICFNILQANGDEGRLIADTIYEAIKRRQSKLILEGRQLDELDSKHFQAFCLLLESLNFPWLDSCMLPFTRISYITPNNANFKLLCNSLRASHFSSLDISHNELGIIDSAWQTLSTILESATLNSLNLTKNHLTRMNAGSWQALSNALKISKLKTLSLRANDLGMSGDTAWHNFCSIFKAPNLTLLDLSSNSLGELNLAKAQIFGELLAASQLQSLNLGYNFLCSLDPKCWQALFLGFTANNLVSLNLNANGLSRLDSKTWKELCTVLQDSKLTSISLRENSLGSLSETDWQAFCDAIKNSSLVNIDLTDNWLEDQTIAYWEWLAVVLKDNHQLLIKGLPHDIRKH